MSKELDAINTLEVVRRYRSGDEPGMCTFIDIDKVTKAYGYGILEDIGTWQYQIA